MKALIICGSGNKDGFTAEMCRAIAEGMQSKDIDSEIIYPLDFNIAHCTGCQLCDTFGKCVLKDDMFQIYERFEDADLLILATPIRFSGPTSIIKMVIDRFQPYWFNKGKHPKYVAGLMCGGSTEPKFSNTMSIFKAFGITTEMQWVGELKISDTDSIKIEDVSNLSYDFGKELARTISKDDQ
ncbi:MAG: flavodoxin family protein [Candidatus Methanomethylophilaceae archaeon]|nr:flavodoxin family protein [Candidatus Methanomethylophilaceae archaeon]MDD3379074.1 flavodoxin family protein [Candidatus Methanomethylophilaceae archaeon]